MYRSIIPVLAVFLTIFLGLTAQAQPRPIEPQPLSQALDAWARQNGLQVIYGTELTKGLKSPGARPGASAKEALTQILAGTGLEVTWLNERTVSVHPGKADAEKASVSRPQALQLARAQAPVAESAAAETASMEAADDAGASGTPEILVKGSRSLNMDIKRTEDAPQPYVVFDRKEIERSQAANIEDFLCTRLPMNTSSGSVGQAPSIPNNYSFINLRGLGSSQTLVLVDGRRLPGIVNFGSPLQPDLNGIPLAAVERIEILPSTAGGIYGGSATGGVVNVILRRNYRGLEAKAAYNNTFDSDTGGVRLDGNTGFSLEGGRTQVMLAFSYADANNLTIGDRNFGARARALQLANYPDVAAWATATTPPLGATVNIRSAATTYVAVAAPQPGTLGPFPATPPYSTLYGVTADKPYLLPVTAPLTLKSTYGGQALGSPITHVPLGYAGPASDNGARLVENAGTYNLDLPNDVNGLKRGLMSAPSMKSVSLNVRREFGERLEAFIDLSRLGNNGSSLADSVPTSATLAVSAPNNPFNQPITVSFPTPNLLAESRSESTTLRGTAGLIARLPRHWTGEIDYGWSRSRFWTGGTSPAVDAGATASTTGSLNTGLPAADGRPALNALQEGNTYPIDWAPYLLPSPNAFTGPTDTVLKDATLRLSGPTLQLAGGPLTLSALIEHREEGIEGSFNTSISATTRERTYVYYPAKSQEADSYYLEARAPLVSGKNARPGMRALELQVSVRRDEYETRGVSPSIDFPDSPDGPFSAFTYTPARLGSTDYTVALKYAPVEDVALRASFGTGFLPPSLSQIVGPNIRPANTTNYGADPKRGNTPMNAAPYELRYGGNSQLEPEESASFSAGFIVAPRRAPEFRLSVDYTRIEKTGEIQVPVGLFILQNEDLYPERIVRGENLEGDLPGWAGPITAFDISAINIATTRVEACDIQADYSLRTERFGTFRGYAVATRSMHFLNQTRPGEPVVESVGFTSGPLKWRGNAGVDWARGAWTLGWNAQYYDPYKIYTATLAPATRDEMILSQGSDTVPSQIYHDLIASYRFGATASFAGGLFADSEVSFGMQNVFDKSPPILAATSPSAQGYSTYGDPRLRRYTLSFRKSFGGGL